MLRTCVKNQQVAIDVIMHIKENQCLRLCVSCYALGMSPNICLVNFQSLCTDFLQDFSFSVFHFDVGR